MENNRSEGIFNLRHEEEGRDSRALCHRRNFQANTLCIQSLRAVKRLGWSQEPKEVGRDGSVVTKGERNRR